MSRKRRVTYKKAGVNIDQAARFIGEIKRLVKTTNRPGVLSDIGSFGGFFGLSAKYKNPVLVSSTDGVGTKLKIAFLANIHDTVGIDLVAMSVNDCLCSGAQPLFFLDYIAVGELKPKVLIDIIKGIVAGCRESNCALIGGETAEMPKFYKQNEYDLSGFCVGVVEKSKIINGSKIKAGDQVIGVASSGLHSNGFSLVRKVFSKKELKKRARQFLTPTRIYVKPILALLKRQDIKGIAHVTGGGFIDKVPRILPEGLSLKLCKNSWHIPEVFEEIKKRANLDGREMLRTFNMGIGMVLVVARADAKKTIKFLKEKFSLESWVIGEIVKGKQEIIV